MANIQAKIIMTPTSDLKVVNAARVSMGKQHDNFDKEKDTKLIKYLAKHNHFTPATHNRELIAFPLPSLTMRRHFEEFLANLPIEYRSSMSVESLNKDNNSITFVKNSLFGWCNLLNYHKTVCLFLPAGFANSIYSIISKKYPVSAREWFCAEVHKAYQVLESDINRNKTLIDHNACNLSLSMFDITFYESVPIFVARQRFKHMVGCDYNEVSRRYVSDEPEIYTVDAWRQKPEKSIKQGSGDVHTDSNSINKEYEKYVEDAKAYYNSLLKRGVAPEQARMILPQSMMTEYFCTMSLEALDRVIGLRIDSHAQKEIQNLARILAEQIHNISGTIDSALNSRHDVMKKLASVGVF